MRMYRITSERMVSSGFFSQVNTGGERRSRARAERRLVEVHHRTAAAGRAHMQPKPAPAQPVAREGHDKGSTRGTMTLMMSACTMHSEEATAKAAG